RGVREVGKAGELRAPALDDARPELTSEVAKEEKRLDSGPLLPHEEHGRGRRQQEQEGRRPDGGGRGQGGEALAEGAVADLVVVLEKRDEGRRRQVTAGLAPRAAPVGRMLTLVREPLGQ